MLPFDVLVLLILVILKSVSTTDVSIPFWLNLARVNKFSAIFVEGLHLKLSPNRKDIFSLIIMLFILNHILACGWIVIHRYFEYDASDTWAIRAGVSAYNPSIAMHNGYNSAWDIYFSAFYFTIVVVSTCGYGDIRPVNNLETLYNIMNALIGSITLGVFVGEFVTFFEILDESQENIEKNKKHKIRNFMSRIGMTPREQHGILKLRI
tara:strand:+ start:135 stop:758 length:624 start_codon:yes stop_codon:yes gene_type:complete